MCSSYDAYFGKESLFLLLLYPPKYDGNQPCQNVPEAGNCATYSQLFATYKIHCQCFSRILSLQAGKPSPWYLYNSYYVTCQGKGEYCWLNTTDLFIITFVLLLLLLYIFLID